MRNIHPRRRPDEGFTLIELLIVIVIMGILAGIVVFSVKGLNNKSATEACNTEVSIVDTAEEAYYANHNSYTATIQDLVDDGLLHRAPKYVAGYDTTANKVTLVASPPAGCTAA